MFDLILAHSYDDDKLPFLILRVQGLDELNKLVLINFRTYFYPNGVRDSSEELDL